MLTFLLYIRAAWNDYFSTGNYPISQIYNSRQTFSDTDVYVSNCLFRSITSTSNGGALYCTTSVMYLLIELTSFFYCSITVQYGGAIYFSNTNNGQCVLHEVCGYDCCSTYSDYSEGQFAYIVMNDGFSSKNFANYTSITRCMNHISNSHHVLALYYGKICCPSVNISMNKCPHGSGIQCRPYIDSNSFTGSLTYSSFADNNATISICIYLFRGGANQEIKSCNILRNTQDNLNSLGIFYSYDNMAIKDSCILENKATCIFYQYSSSYTFTLSNCTVDSTTNNGYLTTKNTVAKSFILALNHIATQNCHSEYDAVGTLTPIISPYSKKQIHCYTYGNSFYPYQQRYLVSLISVFLFNFIHLDSSNYPF
jgi:predicted outer membrane repeat protein